MFKRISYFMIAGIMAFILAGPVMVPVQAAGGGDEGGDKKKEEIPVEAGELAPHFKATDINGKEFDLAHYKGKTVVLEWTNHQCPFVIKHYDTGNMQATQKKAMDGGAVWVSIISSAEGRQGYVSNEEAAAIAKEQGASYDYKILDPSGEIGKLYEAKTTPHMYVIDKNGVLAYSGAIDDNPSPRLSAVEGAKNYVLAALDDLSAGGAVRTPYTPSYGCSVKYAY